jgi:glycosyltransferase involved in cell wall biosynthesis
MSGRRIAFYLPWLAGGGMERVVLTLGGALADAGHSVSIVLDRAGGPLADAVPSGIEISILGARRTVLAAPKLAGWLRAHRPDVLISSLVHNNVTSLLARMLAGRPCRLILWEHNQFSTHARQSGASFRIISIMARLLYRRADALVAVSTGVADDLVATLRLPRDMITVIYNPIPVTDIRRLADGPTAHPWLASDEPPVILGVGRLTKQKDFASLIRAFARVRQQRPVRLIILGDGELRGELEALAQSLGVVADVTLPGFVDNPFPWMKRAAVFALSSAWEGFGNALIEAMACGTPVIATDCATGPAELLDDGRYGPLVPVGNDRALADALCEMLDRPKAAALLTARADAFAAPVALQKFEKLLM